VNPIADTDPATTNSGIDVNRDAVAAFAPGEYEFVAVAKGFGFFRFRASFNAGQVKTQTVAMPTNWASSTGGATASGDGADFGNAIDETELTNWSADGRAADGTLSGILGKQITIDLAGTAARNITDVAVSAMIFPGQSRFAALRSFELWACNAAAGADCSTNAGYAKVFTSAGGAFPGDAPRPIGPQLILRDFQVPKFKATHLRLRVLTNQCTGGPCLPGRAGRRPDGDYRLRHQRLGHFVPPVRPGGRDPGVQFRAVQELSASSKRSDEGAGESRPSPVRSRGRRPARG